MPQGMDPGLLMSTSTRGPHAPAGHRLRALVALGVTALASGLLVPTTASAAPADAVTFGKMRPAYTSPKGNKCAFAASTNVKNGGQVSLQFAASALVPPWQTVDLNSLRWKRVTTLRVSDSKVRAVVRARKDGYWRFEHKGSVGSAWFLDVWPTSDLVGDDGPIDISCPRPPGR